MDTQRAPLDEREQKIADAWAALFEALGQRRSKYRGREIGVRGVGGNADYWTPTAGRLGPATSTSVERFLDNKAVRDAKHVRMGVQ